MTHVLLNGNLFEEDENDEGEISFDTEIDAKTPRLAATKALLLSQKHLKSSAKTMLINYMFALKKLHSTENIETETETWKRIHKVIDFCCV